VNFQAAFGPNNEMGEGHFFFGGPLGLDALLDLLGTPAAG